jgi:hypothetical protein
VRPGPLRHEPAATGRGRAGHRQRHRTQAAARRGHHALCGRRGWGSRGSGDAGAGQNRHRPGATAQGWATTVGGWRPGGVGGWVVGPGIPKPLPRQAAVHRAALKWSRGVGARLMDRVHCRCAYRFHARQLLLNCAHRLRFPCLVRVRTAGLQGTQGLLSRGVEGRVGAGWVPTWRPSSSATSGKSHAEQWDACVGMYEGSIT